MMKESSVIIAQIFQFAVPLLFAVTLHEVSHGWVALKLGDSTAKLQGRLSINPLRHIDPIGTVLVPGLLFYLTGFIFGWAKPVPITWENLNNPKRDMAFVAIAGPFANLVMALIWACLAKLFLLISSSPNSELIQYFVNMAKFGIIINFILMVLNLIPIPPLDGSRVVSSFFSTSFNQTLINFEFFGFILLLLLLVSGVLWVIILPIILFLLKIINYLFGL